MNVPHPHYFSGQVSPGFVALYTGKMIVLVAGDLLGLFIPLFLYELFDQNFSLTIGYYTIASLLYVFALPLGVQWLNRFGFRNALWTSTFFGALFYVLFYFVNKENAALLLSLSIVIVTIYRVMYWVPYHVDFAKFTDQKNRGREISFLSATSDVLGIFIPVIAGFLIVRFGFDVLFVIAIVLYLLSLIPYVTLPHAHEKFSWSYGETWRQLFSRGRRGPVLAFMANGAESVVGLIVWPIFIFLLLHGDYLQVGALSTFIIGVAVVLQLLVGKHVDAFGLTREEQLLKTGSIFYAIGWIAKIFIVTAFHVFVAGAYHSIVKIVMRIPFDVLTYEVAADQGHYVDEFTVLHEMAIHLGKTIMSFVVIGMGLLVPLQWTFVLAALAIIGLNLLPSSQRQLTVQVRAKEKSDRGT